MQRATIQDDQDYIDFASKRYGDNEKKKNEIPIS